jgi:GH15 family glucan-1,4-alpha-glucosidase
VRCIEDRLLVDGFVYRYDSAITDDGLPAGEGAFLACTFWLIDNYLLQGRHPKLVACSTASCRSATYVGLLAEEYHSHARPPPRQLPQAFSTSRWSARRIT